MMIEGHELEDVKNAIDDAINAFASFDVAVLVGVNSAWAAGTWRSGQARVELKGSKPQIVHELDITWRYVAEEVEVQISDGDHDVGLSDLPLYLYFELAKRLAATP